MNSGKWKDKVNSQTVKLYLHASNKIKPKDYSLQRDNLGIKGEQDLCDRGLWTRNWEGE